MKIGFLINPIAGMGGRVGLKGTDGVLNEAIDRGANPIAQLRAKDAIKKYLECVMNAEQTGQTLPKVEWYTAAGNMGYDALVEGLYGPSNERMIQVVFESPDMDNTTAEDTKNACKRFLTLDLDLILFCGGDGTARDIYSVVNDTIPILGIPSGVKMHSGVFATHAHYAGEILVDYINGEMDTAEGEILDLDEDRYRNGEWNIRLFGVAKTPYEPTIIQRGKHFVESATDDEVKLEIAEFIAEELEEDPERLFILGSGSTVAAIAKHIGIDNSLLGIDAILNKKLIGKDLNESTLIALIKKFSKTKLILSPIGAQGFILGRGNLQLSPKVIRRIGIENIVIVSTPAKLGNIEALRVDTNDPELDAKIANKGWLSVIVGYRQMKMKKVAI